MNDDLKHKLYDTFLKNTPISFESVTDEQFNQMRNTAAGILCALTAVFAGAVDAINKFFHIPTNAGQPKDSDDPTKS